MIADLPDRWRREAQDYNRLSELRVIEGRSAAADRLEAAAAAYRNCADDLIEEMGNALPDPKPD